MDQERFDTIAKTWAAGADRRSLLKRTAGAVLGGLFALNARKAAATCVPKDGACDPDHDYCCSGYKCDRYKKVCKPEPICVPKDGACKPDDDKCCDGYKCDRDKKVCKPEPICIPKDKACKPDDDKCCDGYYCHRDKKVCKPEKVDFCGHSVGLNGGCKGACTEAGFTGKQCNPICGNGQFRGYCPVGQGGDNPCCNVGLCDPDNFVAGPNGNPVYTGPTAGC